MSGKRQSLCVQALKGAAQIRVVRIHRPMSDLPLPLNEGAIHFVTSYASGPYETGLRVTLCNNLLLEEALWF